MIEQEPMGSRLNTFDGGMCDIGHSSSTSVLDVPLKSVENELSSR